MIPNLSQMACGGCGNGCFTIWTPGRYAGQLHHPRLYIECTQCGSVTSVAPSIPALEISEGEQNAIGVLCEMNPTKFELKKTKG